MIDNIKELVKKNQEVVAYLFWGVMTTFVSWGSYSVFVMIFQGHDLDMQIGGMLISGSVFISNALSWLCAVLFSFVTNKLWVFNSKEWKLSVVFPEFWKFVSSRLVTGGFEMIAVPFLVGVGLNQSIFGIEGMLSKGIVSIVVVILNYISSKFLVFRE